MFAGDRGAIVRPIDATNDSVTALWVPTAECCHTAVTGILPLKFNGTVQKPRGYSSIRFTQNGTAFFPLSQKEQARPGGPVLSQGKGVRWPPCGLPGKTRRWLNDGRLAAWVGNNT